MNKNIYWPWAIKNIVDIACWTGLAIYFGKWWIGLFAALFVSTLKTNIGNYRICDKCGKHSPYATTYNDAIDTAEASGWIGEVIDGKRYDYCPDCQEVIYDLGV